MNKRRFVDKGNNLDLDLTYVCDRCFTAFYLADRFTHENNTVSQSKPQTELIMTFLLTGYLLWQYRALMVSAVTK